MDDPERTGYGLLLKRGSRLFSSVFRHMSGVVFRLTAFGVDEGNVDVLEDSGNG